MNLKRIGCFALVIIAVIIAGSIFISKIKGNATTAYPSTAYMIITASRTYFSDNVTTENGVYTMHNYYEQVKKKWKLQKQDLTLEPAIFGKVTVKVGTVKND